MDPFTFKVLIEVVKQKETSEKKLSPITNCFRCADYISVYQTVELVIMMPSGSDQLKVARMAYEWTMDPEIFGSVVWDSMKAISAREQLNQLLAKKITAYHRLLGVHGPDQDFVQTVDKAINGSFVRSLYFKQRFFCLLQISVKKWCLLCIGTQDMEGRFWLVSAMNHRRSRWNLVTKVLNSMYLFEERRSLFMKKNQRFIDFIELIMVIPRNEHDFDCTGRISHPY